jgi:hypothetical protein
MSYIKLVVAVLAMLLVVVSIPIANSLNDEVLIVYTRKGDGKSPFLTGSIVLRNSEGVIIANLSSPNYSGSILDPLTIGYVFTLSTGKYYVEVYRFNILVGKSAVELVGSRNLTLVCDVLDLPVVTVEEINPDVPVGNVTLKIYRDDGILIDKVLVGPNGKYVVQDLPYGGYVFKVLKFNITIAEEKCKLVSYHVNSTSKLSIKCKVGDLNVRIIDQNGRTVNEGVLEATINNYLYGSVRVSKGVALFKQVPIDYLLGFTDIGLNLKVYDIPVSINVTTVHMNKSRSIVIQSLLYNLNIKLIDSASRIVSNATLVLKRNNLEIKSFNVDGGGLTITQIPEGSYVLTVKRFNIPVAVEEITVHTDLSLVINCRVIDVTLSVFDKYNRSINQVKADLLHDGQVLASNISIGEAIRQVPPSKYVINLWREGVPIGSYLMDLTNYTKPSIVYEIRNIPLPSLAVRCIDLNGNPVLNSKVLIYDLMIGNPVETVASSGYALFSDLWPGKYVVMAEFEVVKDSRVFSVKSDADLVNVPGTSLHISHVLICPVNINGVVRVLDAYGNPLPRIPVNITAVFDSKSYTWIKDTDESGVAQFNGLFGSKYLAQAYVGGVPRSMLFIESFNSFDVELRIYSVQLTPFGILEVWFVQSMIYALLILVLASILYYVFKQLKKQR